MRQTSWRTNTSTPWCSVGFTARNSSNQRYVYTAGHCSTGNNVTWGTGALNIGPMWSSTNSGAIDAAIIRVTNSWFASDSGGEIYMNGGSSVPVKGVAPTVGYMVAGETVCLSANFTQPTGGNLCGILGANSDAAVRGMARVDGVDACGGDSGGGWYWLSSSGNRYAYGIHSRSERPRKRRRQPQLVHRDREREERLPAGSERRDRPVASDPRKRTQRACRSLRQARRASGPRD